MKKYKILTNSVFSQQTFTIFVAKMKGYPQYFTGVIVTLVMVEGERWFKTIKLPHHRDEEQVLKRAKKELKGLLKEPFDLEAIPDYSNWWQIR